MIRKLLYLCTDNTDPYHNLALEQYLTDTVPADTCILYLWQNRHTVVIGRNQNAWQECRTALLEQDGGKLSRRLSGGGAVYHDMGNLNFTFSLPTAEYDLHRQQRVIVEACRSLGIEASFSGRNDILAAGRKFSGNSFYHHNGCSFHNGTLLVSVDMSNLGKYLTPSQRKLQSKGVASVPSRVVNLSELHPGLRISQMQQAMAQAFADVYGLPVTTITESQLDASEIEARRMRFASYDWIYGRAQPFPFSCGARYPWGEITLELQVEGDYVSAKGTTLGGDDGIAVAMALAILDSSEIAHPALEAVFTVDEEIGMEGAQGLDFSQLSARRMLNIDSEDEGIFTVSCAGGASANVSVGLTMAPNAAPCVKLTVSGLIGGHSGQEINKGRANANILLGRVLDALVQKLPARLVSAAGGRKDNAIPNAAEAVLALAEADLPAAKQIVSACTADLRKEYAVADPGVTVTLEEAAVCPQALTEEATLRVVRYLLLVPNGIAAMSMDIPGLVQTSCNLGIFHVADGVLTAVSSVRSSVASQKQMLLARFAALSQLLGGSLQVTGAYPAWEYRRESVLREKMAAVYEQQTGKAPKIEAIHAGLECGLFAGQLPGLDCVSFGPDLVDIHTAREKMSISSVQRTWKFLLGVLEALKD